MHCSNHLCLDRSQSLLSIYFSGFYKGTLLCVFYIHGCLLLLADVLYISLKFASIHLISPLFDGNTYGSLPPPQNNLRFITLSLSHPFSLYLSVPKYSIQEDYIFLEIVNLTVIPSFAQNLKEAKVGAPKYSPRVHSCFVQTEKTRLR